MPEHIDEQWEYWEPDPEIAEVMCGESVVVTFDNMKNTGFRSGKGNPDNFSGWLKQAKPERYREPKKKKPKTTRTAKLVIVKECEQCHTHFSTKDDDRVFCGKDCYVTYVHANRKLVQPCKKCGRPFPKTNSRRAFCSEACRNRGNKKVLQDRQCPGCHNWFSPDRSSRQYCSMKCRPFPGRRKTVPKVVIEMTMDGGQQKGGWSAPFQYDSAEEAVLALLPMCSPEFLQRLKLSQISIHQREAHGVTGNQNLGQSAIPERSSIPL